MNEQGWTTDQDLAAARDRFAAQVNGYVPPPAFALARRDPDKLVFGHVNQVGAARGLPAAALAVACGYSDKSGAYELTGADVRRVLQALPPAESATHVPHPNIWSWRELLEEADDQASFVAFYLAREGDEPRSSEDEQFHALAVPER